MEHLIVSQEVQTKKTKEFPYTATSYIFILQTQPESLSVDLTELKSRAGLAISDLTSPLSWEYK